MIRWTREAARIAAVAVLSIGMVAALTTPTALDAQTLDALSPEVREFVSFENDQVLIRNVTLIDGTGAPAQRGASVLIDGDRISAVAPNCLCRRGLESSTAAARR